MLLLLAQFTAGTLAFVLYTQVRGIFEPAFLRTCMWLVVGSAILLMLTALAIDPTNDAGGYALDPDTLDPLKALSMAIVLFSVVYAFYLRREDETFLATATGATATGIGVALILVGNVLGPKRPSSEKLSPYECGFGAFENARMPFDVRYYLVAILFIVFDLEIAFVFPWAVVFRELGVFGLIEMGVFLTLLVIGFVYVWKRGALEWE